MMARSVHRHLPLKTVQRSHVRRPQPSFLDGEHRGDDARILGGKADLDEGWLPTQGLAGAHHDAPLVTLATQQCSAATAFLPPTGDRIFAADGDWRHGKARLRSIEFRHQARFDRA